MTDQGGDHPTTDTQAARIAELEAQRAAALRLHHPERQGLYTVCARCETRAGDGWPWPCPTAEALGAS